MKILPSQPKVSEDRKDCNGFVLKDMRVKNNTRVYLLAHNVTVYVYEQVLNGLKILNVRISEGRGSSGFL